MTSTDLIREMQRAGWQLNRVHGSHHIFKHPSRPGIVVVPHPKKGLGTGLVKAIKKIKLEFERFIDALSHCYRTWKQNNRLGRGCA